MPQTIGVMSSFSDHEFRRLNVHMLTDPGPYGRDSPFLVFPITPSKTALRGVSKPLRAMATKNGHQPLAHFHWKQEASRIHLHLSLSTRQRILSSYTTSFPSMRTNLREDVIGPTGRRALRLRRSYGCGVSSGIWIPLLGCSLAWKSLFSLSETLIASSRTPSSSNPDPHQLNNLSEVFASDCWILHWEQTSNLRERWSKNRLLHTSRLWPLITSVCLINSIVVCTHLVEKLMATNHQYSLSKCYAE
jgi:hypothetical protein